MAANLRTPNVVVRGEVEPDIVDYARTKVLAVASATTVPVLSVEVRLDHHADPARPRPNRVELSLDLDGLPVRAHDSAPTMRAAIDATVDRLRRNVEHATDRAQSLQFRHRGAGSWRHGDPEQDRPEFFPRPVEERQIVRRKTFSLRPESIEDALFDLERLDHHFFLFVHDETGADAVVTRDHDGGYEVRQVVPTPDAIERTEVPVRTGQSPATMSTHAALTLLDETDARFVFFVDPDSGRGNVVYRRYDGNYGLIIPT
jgi:ribosome-associated translation inhibitor RaiA